MSGLLPSDREGVTDEAAGDVRVLEIDDADHLIESLSSETARAVLSALHQDTATASELAETVDTSLQNVRHHLDTLIDADLVQVVDTQYSVKGREMDVYGPVEDALVVCVGGDSDHGSLVDQLTELVGAAALLAVASLFVQYAFETATSGVGGPETSPRVADSVSATEPLLGFLPPGLAFFAGGLLVLLALLAWRNRDVVTG
ncbi:ArsR/SmtB family transcription factor [Haloparvum sp. PAK95]|uniref:ArsR/SmtB family transcription factor n=1 Tax=Haloparvum sp. PAK95 TaxID=3418962 RepID=UPI003D2EB85C